MKNNIIIQCIRLRKNIFPLTRVSEIRSWASKMPQTALLCAEHRNWRGKARTGLQDGNPMPALHCLHSQGNHAPCHSLLPSPVAGQKFCTKLAKPQDCRSGDTGGSTETCSRGAIGAGAQAGTGTPQL